MIAGIAFFAHGVVTREELLAARVTSKQIERRVEKGTLIPEYRGVYRVGHRAASRNARYIAAVKASGDGSVLCDLAAAHLLRLIKGDPPPPKVMTLMERCIEGLDSRRARRIDPCDVSEVDGIPVTTVPRTLVDLAALLDEDALARACHEAGVRYRTTPAHVQAVLERRPNSPGAPILMAIMTGDVKVSLSELERRFLAILRAAGLPLPITNKIASGRRVDARWPDHKLTVELDGFRFHNSRYAWEQTLEREREARNRGDEFRRFSYADVFEDPAYMLAELTKLLT